jgi:hypothetical protein
MQGPSGFLNVLTIPTGATIYQQRIVIDGIRGAIFVYGEGIPTPVYDIAIVQALTVPGSLSGSFPKAVTAGNAVVIGVVAIGPVPSSPSITSVTLNGSSLTESEQDTTSETTGGNWFLTGIWAGFDLAGGETTVAATGTNAVEAPNDNFGLVLLEVSGLASLNQIGANNNGNVASEPWSSTVSAPTTTPTELVVGTVAFSTSMQTGGQPSNPPWIPLNLSSFAQGLWYQVITTEQTPSIAGTLNTAGFWVSTIAAYAGAVLPGPIGPGPLIASMSWAGDGTDPYGNEYLSGFTAYSTTQAASLNNGILIWYQGSATDWTAPIAAIEANTAGSYINIVAAGGLYINGVGPVTP